MNEEENGELHQRHQHSLNEIETRDTNETMTTTEAAVSTCSIYC